MTGAVVPLPSPQPPSDAGTPYHCPAVEYERFIARSGHSDDLKTRLGRRHARFLRHFPDLRDWFDQPLRQRLGWRNKDTQTRRLGPGNDFDVTAGWINYNARDYLIYLALTGRLRLDWGWLLGSGVIRPAWIADQLGLPLTSQIDQLRAQVTALGHNPDSSTFRVSWTVIRLVLHLGHPDLHAITADDVEDMRETIRTIDQIPGIEEVLSPQHLSTITSAWGTNVFRTGIALFHAGFTDRLPPRRAPAPPPPLNPKPRIAAVMNRYLVERALIVRPESMSATRAGLRRLGLWLTQQRPNVDSLAQLTRADLLDFMTWLHQQRKIKHSEQPLGDAYKRGIISEVTVFFRYGAHAEWPTCPPARVLTRMDVPARCSASPATFPSTTSNR